ncbi:MAG: hypothetical protein IBJ11_02335 [Phycisphaerales bacterium]|nr:hypothetical protein [Phycisphaerales bacterium]
MPSSTAVAGTSATAFNQAKVLVASMALGSLLFAGVAIALRAGGSLGPPAAPAVVLGIGLVPLVFVGVSVAMAPPMLLVGSLLRTRAAGTGDPAQALQATVMSAVLVESSSLLPAIAVILGAPWWVALVGVGVAGLMLAACWPRRRVFGLEDPANDPRGLTQAERWSAG